MAVVTDIAKGVLADNIRTLMETHGLNKADLSKETGIPSATIGYIVDGATFNPRIATLLTIANYFQVTLDYLVGSPCKLSEKSINSTPITQVAVPESEDGVSKVPVLEWKDVRYWLKHRFDFLKNATPEWIATTLDLSEEAFALVIPYQTQGVFPKKSIIIADPAVEYRSADYVLGSIRGGIPIIKKIFREHDKMYLNSVGVSLASEEVNDENRVVAKIVECRTFFMPEKR